MKLKLDENGNAVLVDGPNGTKLPIYIHDDGKEAPFDAGTTVATISRLNGEAKGHRERAEAAEGKLRAFEGIEDAEAARKALETVANLDAGKLLTAQKVEEIKVAAQQAAREQLTAAQKQHATELQTVKDENGKLTAHLHSEIIGGAFSRSKFIADKVAIPPDLLQSKFGHQLKVENGKAVAYDANGAQIFSRVRGGELADFEEAIEIIINAYPHKDQILKGEVRDGGGAGGGGGGKQKSAGKWDGNLAERTAAIASRFPNLST